jgi:hypothetical protein
MSEQSMTAPLLQVENLRVSFKNEENSILKRSKASVLFQ